MDKATCGKSKDFSWSRTATECLIQLYENYPCLYCTTLPEYKNKNKQTEAFKFFKLIAEQLNAKMLMNLTAKEVQTKVHGLITQYLSEQQKIKKSKVSGTSPDSVYVPKWYYFKLLSFLDAQGMIVSQGESNLTIRSDDRNDTQSNENLMATDTTFSQELECEVLFDGTVEEISSVSPGLLSPELVTPDEDQEIPPSSSCGKERPLKRRKLSSAPRSYAAKLIEHAPRALDQIQGSSQNIPTNSPHMYFAQMLGLELQNMELHEDVIDQLKGKIMVLMLKAKEDIRKRKQNE